MDSGLNALLITAVSIGFIHTLIGPDHYLPFIAIAKARKWTVAKTALVTFICGLGHVGSSVVIGLIGIGLGITISKVEVFEGFRGDLAAWLLFTFGLGYMIWGLWRAWKKPHDAHVHILGGKHTHDHGEPAENGKSKHNGVASWKELTPWILFTVFVFGPCEPLVPILMYPAAKLNMAGVILVAFAFAAATIGTMLVIVIGALMGLKPVALPKLSRFGHALAGFVILLCGAAIMMGL